VNLRGINGRVWEKRRGQEEGESAAILNQN
jgi:hypothetical protein